MSKRPGARFLAIPKEEMKEECPLLMMAFEKEERKERIDKGVCVSF